jgi:hypothetical protein
MKKALLTIASILMISLMTQAQDKDSARVEKGNSEIRQNDQADPQRPTADEAGGEGNQNNAQKNSQNSNSSSSNNQASPIPRGEPAILDGTNAIPVDSSKESGQRLKNDVKRSKKKSEN